MARLILPVLFIFAAIAAGPHAGNAQAAASSLRVDGDIDGDGAGDTVELQRGAGGYSLTIWPGATGAGPVVIDSGPADRAPDYLELAAPGVFQTTPAGEGAPPPERIETASRSIVYGTREASAALVYWTGAEFRTVWLSD